MLEKYSKEEILGFIEAGYKNLGDIGGKNAGVALIRGLPSHEEWGCMEVGSVLEFLEGLDIPRDYVPPRMLVRRALALMLAFNETVRDLERSARTRVVDIHCLLRVERLALGSVADAYQMPDAEVDELLHVIFRGRGF